MPDAGARRVQPWRRWLWILLVVLGVLSAVIIPAYITVPKQNNNDPQVDVLLVLGSPTEIDGSLTSTQRWRVDEAVREYRAGRAAHILMSGGMTSLNYVESDTMAAYARQLGVPQSAILEERTSKTTLENIRNSQALLDAHGWRRVEVISSPEHLARAALLLEHSHLLWRTHAAPTPGRSRLQTAGAYAEEAVGTAVIRVFGPRAEPVLHAYSVVQHWTVYAVRWVYYKLRGW